MVAFFDRLLKILHVTEMPIRSMSDGSFETLGIQLLAVTFFLMKEMVLRSAFAVSSDRGGENSVGPTQDPLGTPLNSATGMAPCGFFASSGVFLM